MSAFYEQTFGWKMVSMGVDMGEYVVAQTTETDGAGMVQKPGHINGGFFKRNSPSVGPNIVIAVDDLDRARVKIAGAGCMLDDAMDIPGIGRYCTFTDTEGNRVSVLQPSSR